MSEIDANLVITIITTVIGLATAVFAGNKYVTFKSAVVETIGDVADLLALIYAVSKKGSCDEASMKSIASKTEEIWTDLDTLGPSVSAILASKSSVAKAIEIRK